MLSSAFTNLVDMIYLMSYNVIVHQMHVYKQHCTFMKKSLSQKIANMQEFELLMHQTAHVFKSIRFDDGLSIRLAIHEAKQLETIMNLLDQYKFRSNFHYIVLPIQYTYGELSHIALLITHSNYVQ